MDRLHGIKATKCFSKFFHYALQSNQTAVHLETKDAMFWIPCSRSYSPWMSRYGSQITHLMLIAAYHPAASQIACRFGMRALGCEHLGSLLDCFKALRPCPVVVSDSFRCMSSWKLGGVRTPSQTDVGNSASGLGRKSEQCNTLYKIIVQVSENKQTQSATRFFVNFDSLLIYWFNSITTC